MPQTTQCGRVKNRRAICDLQTRSRAYDSVAERVQLKLQRIQDDLRAKNQKCFSDDYRDALIDDCVELDKMIEQEQAADDEQNRPAVLPLQLARHENHFCADEIASSIHPNLSSRRSGGNCTTRSCLRPMTTDRPSSKQVVAEVLPTDEQEHAWLTAHQRKIAKWLENKTN